MTSPGQPPATVPSYPASEGSSGTAEHLDGTEALPSSGAERLVFVAVCLAAGVLASLPAAWVWTALADPPSARLSETGLQFGELAFDHVSAITFWFVAIGFGFGLGLGLVAALLGRRHGIVTVLAILIMSVIAAILTLWCGVHLFGPDHPVDFVALFNSTPKQRTEVLAGFHNGDLLVSTLRLTTGVGLLGWPTGAMVGALIGAFCWPNQPKAAWMPPM